MLAVSEKSVIKQDSSLMSLSEVEIIKREFIYIYYMVRDTRKRINIKMENIYIFWRLACLVVSDP